MTQLAATPGPLWPDDVVAGAAQAIRAVRTLDAENAELARFALNAPEVTAHLLAQHKDGYDSGVEMMRALSLASDEQVARYELRLREQTDGYDYLLAENARLAAALADAERAVKRGEREPGEETT